ncbi:MG406 family protein [Spiroplasma syrphidicola]|uniref:MG406 family protein n=1 Tax=Spiroplasma syrphidicola TaxID=216945 RepID=UPI0011818685|nr:MG406 family protein [Spiroplasma syrphidicola]
MSLISIIMLFGALIVLTVLYFSVDMSWNIYTGLGLGYLFSLIGFLIIIWSWWLLSISLNKFLFVLLYFFRIFIYLIPIVIFVKAPNSFSIITLAIGLVIYPLSALLVNIKLPLKHRKLRKEVANCE